MKYNINELVAVKEKESENGDPHKTWMPDKLFFGYIRKIVINDAEITYWIKFGPGEQWKAYTEDNVCFSCAMYHNDG